MDDSDHIIWQASQPKCEALTVLMSKAQRPNPNQTTHTTQEWSSFDDFGSSQSSSFSSSSMPPSSLRSRKNKRRRPYTSESDSEMNLDEDSPSFPISQSQLASPSKLVSLIRNASQRVEESSEMKRRSLERSRLKAKRKVKERRKHPDPEPSRPVANEQLLDKLRKRESDATRSFQVAKGKGREDGRMAQKAHVESSVMDVDDDTARMPPPQQLPARFAPRNNTSNRERVRGDSSSLTDSSNQSDSSTSHSSSQSDSSTSHYSNLSDSSIMYSSTQSNSSNTTLDSPLPPPPIKIVAPSRPPDPTPSEQSQPSSSQTSQKPKTRVLGMRRYASAPSGSQHGATAAVVDVPLPTKQKQFKPPLTKRSASLLATIQAAQSLESTMPGKTVSAALSRSSEVPQAPTRAKVNSGSNANDNFDSSFDMDLDELWTACSAYD